jgi:hypothetical protein
MSKFDIPTLTATCPACQVESVHRVVLEDSQVRHLRCDACDAGHVCSTKGSYQAVIHALPFEELVKLTDQDSVEAYSIHTAYHPTGVFEHPKFGAGYVFAILSPPKKMEVLFADKARFLVCGPGSGILEPEPEQEEPDDEETAEPEATTDESPSDDPPPPQE